MSNVRFKKSSIMSKRDKNKQIQEEINKQAEYMTPAIYASLALALHTYWGFGFKRIDRLFYQSQYIWDRFGRDMEGTEKMIDLCEQRTGIKLKGEK